MALRRRRSCENCNQEHGVDHRLVVKLCCKVCCCHCNELVFFDVFSYPPISRDRCYLHYDPDTSCAPVTSGKGRAIAVETLDDSVDDNDDDGNHYCLL